MANRRLQYVYDDDGRRGRRGRRPQFEDDSWRDEAEEFLYGSFDGRSATAILDKSISPESVPHLYSVEEDILVAPVSMSGYEYPAVTRQMWDAYTNPQASQDELDALESWEVTGGLVARMHLLGTSIEGLVKMREASQTYAEYRANISGLIQKYE